MLKKFLCWILGHHAFVCDSCRLNLNSFFASSNGSLHRSWKCDDQGRCQNVCARCGAKI